MSLVRNMDHDNDYTQDGWMHKMQNRMIRWLLKNLFICSLYLVSILFGTGLVPLFLLMSVPASSYRLILIIPLRGLGTVLSFFEVFPQVGNSSWSPHHHGHVNTVVTFTFYSYFLALLMYLEQKYGCMLFPFFMIFCLSGIKTYVNN